MPSFENSSEILEEVGILKHKIESLDRKITNEVMRLPEKKQAVFHRPVISREVQFIIDKDLAIHKALQKEKVIALENELAQIEAAKIVGSKESVQRKLSNARSSENRAPKSFDYTVTKDKPSSHASAAASCAKQFLNELLRMCLKCDRVLFQLMELDNITAEAYELGLLGKHVQVGMIAEWNQFVEELKPFLEFNLCNDMNDVDHFLKRHNYNEKQKNFFLTTNHEERLRLAAKKKKVNSPKVVTQLDDNKIILKYFTPKISMLFKLDDEFIKSMNVEIERIDKLTGKKIKSLFYRLDYAYKEIRNKSFNIYGEKKKQKQLAEALIKNQNLDSDQGATAAAKATKVKRPTKEKLVPNWMQNVKISSLNPKTKNSKSQDNAGTPLDQEDLATQQAEACEEQGNQTNLDSDCDVDSSSDDDDDNDNDNSGDEIITSKPEKKKRKVSQSVCSSIVE